MTTSETLGVLVLSVVLAACASKSPPPAATNGQVPGQAQPTPAQESATVPTAELESDTDDGFGCPGRLPEGTNVRAAEVEGAAALDFTTRGDVGELREHVRKMAGHHDEMRAGRSQMDESGRGRGGGMMKARGPMASASATVEDIEGGARLVMRPEDPSDTPMLRHQLETRATRMSEGHCPMMAPSDPDVGSTDEGAGPG